QPDTARFSKLPTGTRPPGIPSRTVKRHSGFSNRSLRRAQPTISHVPHASSAHLIHRLSVEPGKRWLIVTRLCERLSPRRAENPSNKCASGSKSHFTKRTLPRGAKAY